jgi:hypothetical protein
VCTGIELLQLSVSNVGFVFRLTNNGRPEIAILSLAG